MLYILSFIAVMAWRLCATFVVLFILTVPDLEYYALSLHRLLLDYPINLYIYNLQVVSEKVCKPIFFLSLYLETLK